MGLTPEIRERASVLALGSRQVTDLVQLVQTPGYAVLLDLMELVAREQESGLINVPVDNAPKVLAEHAITHAQWRFFVRLQRMVKYLVDEREAAERGQGKDDELTIGELLAASGE